MLESIPPTGLSVISEPETGSPMVDIVLVHGLKGHPYKTWTSSQVPPATPKQQVQSIRLVQAPAKKKKSGMRTPLAWLKKITLDKEIQKEELMRDAVNLPEVSERGDARLFWPADLLPKECPNARILSYGYDTKITKYMSGATNKNSVFSHSKDFLFALNRTRVPDRPLIFLAHSLGGIVVKEMLTRSSTSMEIELVNIVESTAAVIFLGTPHRGSPDLSSLGEWARSFFSILRFDTTSTILDTLGLKTTDLERAQEGFSGIWQKYDFRVKTFQEGLGLTGINLGVLGNKVVPDFSSLIGDQREHAETLQANHLEMCRFTGADDPNYVKVAGELRSMYLSIVNLNTQSIHQHGKIQWSAPGFKANPTFEISQETDKDERNKLDATCLESLGFPTMNRRRQTIGAPMTKTCNWLLEHQTYQDWFHNRSFETHHGLLLLKGKPGTGKSTLMKEAFHRATQSEVNPDFCTAAFFFDAKGDELQRSSAGLLRSLLYQLLPHYPEQLRNLGNSFDWRERADNSDKNQPALQEAHLESFIRTMFSQRLPKRAIIFIDALDECDFTRSQLYFWREITELSAPYSHLSVCISLRHFPTITVNQCSEITVESHNQQDISTYVNQKFRISIAATEPEWKWQVLHTTVLEKSSGVFLWVVLVIDGILKKWDEGKGIKFLLEYLNAVPKKLETLFATMVQSLSHENRQLAVRVFQWAILASRPLRLHEWHHILAFVKQPSPLSLKDWRTSEEFTDSDEQLERAIRNISGGLLEVRAWRFEEQQMAGVETVSVLVGAGSLDCEQGGARIIQVIHESVREFFLNHKGFCILDPSLNPDPIGKGHISIMTTCIDYLSIPELDTLIRARGEAKREAPAHQFRRLEIDGQVADHSDSDIIDESAIDSDDSSEWESSFDYSAQSSMDMIDLKEDFKLRRSNQPRIPMKNHPQSLPQPGSAPPRLGVALDSNSLESSPHRPEKDSLIMNQTSHSLPNSHSKISQSNARPAVDHVRLVHDDIAQSPRMTRRQMLEVGLSESLRRHLLGEKQLNSSMAAADLKRRQSWLDRSNVKHFRKPSTQSCQNQPSTDNNFLAPSFSDLSHPAQEVLERAPLAHFETFLTASGPKAKRSKFTSALTQQIKEKPTDGLVFETLKHSSLPTPQADVHLWVGMTEMVGEMPVVQCATCHTELSCRSQVLEDYFALLQYATLSLFTHAHLAEAENMDLGPVFDRLREEKTWTRWVALREDLPWGISFLKYLSIVEKMLLPSTSNDIAEFMKQGDSRRLGQRTFSVASFSSASSYA